MVRLVFRPYTQLRRSICTSESLRSSIRVSPDFDLARHSSPSFGSQRVHSCYSAWSEVIAKCRGCAKRIAPQPSKSVFAFTTPLSLGHSMARAHVKLLGPCFKTGRRGRRPTRDRDANRASKGTLYKRSLHYPSQTQPGTRGLKAEARKLHPRPRCVQNGSSRMAATKCRRRPSQQRDRVLADPTPPGRPDVTLNRHRRLREPLRLLLSGFTYSWTLSSKCFSTFPHGTCSLSVSLYN